MKVSQAPGEPSQYSRFLFAHDLALRAFIVVQRAIDIHPEALVEK